MNKLQQLDEAMTSRCVSRGGSAVGKGIATPMPHERTQEGRENTRLRVRPDKQLVFSILR